jgi:pimeloyl-ACP methyl ester carboxylesterase
MTNELSDEMERLKLMVDLSGIAVSDVVLPVSRHVVLGGMRLHYLDWGTDGRPPILFLHGGALNAHTWDAVCLTLRAEYRCLALDQRGHGDSEWSPVMDYGPDAHVRDIEAFADHHGLDRFILVGQSMGGLNAFVYASRHSERLAGLVIIDTGPGVRPAGGQRIIDFVGQTAEIESIDEFVRRAAAFNPLRDLRLLRWSVRHNLRRLPNGNWMRKHDMRHWQTTDARAIVERIGIYWDDTARVTCPTLIVRGERSDVFFDEDAERFADALPDGRWVKIAAAGHNVQGDNPRGLLNALDQFLPEVCR